MFIQHWDIIHCKECFKGGKGLESLIVLFFLFTLKTDDSEPGPCKGLPRPKTVHHYTDQKLHEILIRIDSKDDFIEKSESDSEAKAVLSVSGE